MTSTNTTTTDLTRLLELTLSNLERMTAAARAIAAERDQALAIARTLEGQLKRAEADAAALRGALAWYGELKYSHRMGLPCEAQWVAETALASTTAGVTLLAELTTLRELSVDVERWRESSDARDLAYVLETADKYDAMKARAE